VVSTKSDQHQTHGGDTDVILYAILTAAMLRVY